jgi:hypothetical protein
VTDLDLTSRIVAGARPVDDPVLAMVEDTARLTVTHGWPLYLRLLDLPAALTARRYAADGDLVLEVTDDHLPDNAGRWELAIEGGVATCRRTDRAPRPLARHAGARHGRARWGPGDPARRRRPTGGARRGRARAVRRHARHAAGAVARGHVLMRRTSMGVGDANAMSITPPEVRR